MKKKLTLKTIAKHFNVSIATISKALKNSYDISEERRKEVQKFAKENGYKPNIFALGLKRNKTNTIGLILPNILNLYFAKVFSGVEKIANEHGYNVVICISNDNYQKEVDATNMFVNGTVDGFIVSLAEETQKLQNYSHFKNAIKQDVGLVMIDRVTDEVNCDKVIVNDAKAAYDATEYFISNQRKNIALVSIISHTSVGKLRIQGYKKALENNNILVDENLIIRVGKNDDLETLLKVVLGSRKVDALLCLEETATISTLEILKKLHYKIPENISLIGFTNGELLQHVTPKVTSVSQHGVFMGEQAMRFLAAKLKEIEEDKVSSSKTKIVKTTILERESTIKL
ncbi:transcriptional regulator, LacI family [Lutibacter oricola]|uniref:Transcriptional regulator, LacI family n=1 Tax=Lutibacter oricola TaxID=762486 RepID=A0A1H3DLN1_9FLAO|nr:LacI family DNA-binding transcriptional regulator [Lutibacter oricola]SDX67316.1 transcriptional regulator, LacI family [Lutibacter oricola]